MPYDCEYFLDVGLGIVGGRPPSTDGAKLTAFRAYFKIHPILCAYLHSVIASVMPVGYLPKHLLWTLYFLYHYSTERAMAKALHTNRETLRKWIWPTLVGIGNHLQRFVSYRLRSVRYSFH